MRHNFCLIIPLLILLGSTQGIPQILPTNNTLGANTNYLLNYFSLKNIPSTTTFTIDFSNTDIQVTQGDIACNASLNDVLVPSPSCSCSGSICSLKPNQSASFNTKVMIQFAGLTNPLYLFTQRLSVSIYFNPSITQENYDISIPSSAYKTMDVIINSFQQDDYGVGSTPVTYIFNLSLHYVSQNLQLQIQIPDEIGYNTITSQMSFYGTIQNIFPFQIQSLLIFNIQTPQIINPDGYMLLKLTGFANPQYIGSSSSFRLVFQQTTAQSNCATCKIAELSEGLIVQSKTPGDIKILSMTSTNLLVAQNTTFSISLELYAGVPVGGKIFINLPSQVEPFLPIACKNVYGFELSDGKSPLCTYDTANHRIQTENFASPYDIEIGSAIISIDIYNALDTRSVLFSLETTDDQGRTIGITRNPQSYSAMPIQMNSTVTKSNTQVGSMFTLSCQITLQMNLQPTNIIETILPSGVAYDLPNIKCISAGQDLSCSIATDSVGQLVLSMNPPCVKCSNGDVLTFSITNLKNPSFINNENQIVYVHTKTSNGIIEAAQHSISLLAGRVDLVEYNRPLNQKIGQSYDLQLKLNVPEYVINEGGQIQISFDEYAAYTDVAIDNNAYQMVYQVDIQDSSNKVYPNTLQYYTNLTPQSIKKVIFEVCKDSSCSKDTPLVFIIKGLKQSYIPSLQAKEMIKISTLVGQQIAQTSIETTMYSPIMNSGSITISLSKSITNTHSDYQFTIQVPQIVIDQTIQLQLSIGQTIQGSCSLAVEGLMSGTYTCHKVNDRTININMDYQQALMITNTATYTVKIEGVTTPTSTAPLNYKIKTKFNSTINQQFSSYYRISSPFPLDANISKSNNTINELCNLQTFISPITQDYDSYQLDIPVDIIVITKTNAEASGFTFSQNSTHYILKNSGKMTLNMTSIPSQNTISTINTGHIIITTLKQTYEVQRANISMASTEPITIGVSVSSSNSTVSISTDLTIDINRNNDGRLSQAQLVVYLPSNAFNYQEAKYNGQQIDLNTLSVRIPILVSDGQLMSVVMNDILNLAYVPVQSDQFHKLKVQMVNQNGQLVGVNEIEVKQILSNDGLDVSTASAIRNVTKSSDFTAITINYETVLGKTGDYIQITLPQNQNEYLESSSCMSGTQPCTIISSNFSVIVAQYTTNQTYTLTNVLNNHPNTNLMKINILTNQQQLVEECQTLIQPSILLQELSVSILPSSRVVASQNQLTISLKSIQLAIEPSHKLTIDIPTQSFSRKLNQDDCTIEVDGNSYTGCQYVYNDEWLSSVVIPSLSPFTIPANTSIIIRLHVTNAWSAYPFNDKSITFHINNAQSSLSQGKIPLVQVFQLQSSLELQPIINANLSQSVLEANKDNTLSLDILFSGNYIRESELIVMIPKDTYNIQTQYFKEDSLYYYLKGSINCSQDVCTGGYAHNQTIQLTNGKYVKSNRNKLMAYIQYDGYYASQLASVQPTIYDPQSIQNVNLSRSTDIAYGQSEVSIELGLNDNFDEVSINISNYMGHVTTYTYLYQSSYQPINNLQHTNNSIVMTIPIPQPTINIKLIGRNSLLVTDSQETINFIIYNQTHVLYQTRNQPFPNQLVPYSSGLALQRTQSTVNTHTPLVLIGQLPSYDMAWSNCIVQVNGIQYQQVVDSHVINIQLQQYLNPPSIDGQLPAVAKISMGNYIIYQNSGLTISPPLQPMIAESNQVILTVADRVRVDSQTEIVIGLNNVKEAKEYEISLPSFYSQIISCMGSYNGTKVVQGCSSSQNTITISQADPVMVNQIRIKVKAIQYQTTFNNYNVSFKWETPSTVYHQLHTIQIYGHLLQSQITPSSLRTKVIADYNLNVKSIGRQGILIITLPPHLSAQIPQLDSANIMIKSMGNLLGSSQYSTQQLNNEFSYLLQINGTSTDIQLGLMGISNPNSNQPQLFKLSQCQKNNHSLVYGYKQETIVMEQLDQITITQAERNISKIGDSIQLQMVIICPNYSDTIFIQFPESQVISNQTSCKLLIDSVQQPCEYTSNNTIKATNKPGQHTYIVQSLKNTQYSQNPTASDKVMAWIGEPYQMAQTTLSTTVHITPLIVTGSIHMMSASSLNNIKSHYNTLKYELMSENWDKCDGLVIQFYEKAYWAHRNMECMVNNQLTTYKLINSSAIFIQVGDLRAQTMTISIAKIINYIENGPLAIRSVKQKTEEEKQASLNILKSSYNSEIYRSADYGILDLFQSDQSNIVFVPSSPSFRIIFPNNYVSSQEKTIIAINDDQYPSQLPTASLYYSFTSSSLGCSSPNIPFNSQITLKCVVRVSGSITFTIQLYHQQQPNLPLALVTKSTYIYNEPTTSCLNSLCDLCSHDNNQEYCFSCREQMVSSNGQCVSQCPSSTFSYESVCTDCAPECSSCFDLYDSTCLECRDANLLLDSGTCKQNCQTGFQYEGKCVSGNECTNVEGCRLCSITQFCYQCLPDYDGQPICQRQQLLPPTALSYGLIPFIVLLIVLPLMLTFKFGCLTVPNMLIFNCSLVELMSWILAVPRIPNHPTAMVLCSFVLLRIILSIVSYETYYNKHISSQRETALLKGQSDEQSNKSQKKEEEQIVNHQQTTCKQKLSRFWAHFLNVDSYELLQTMLGKPYMSILHHKFYMLFSIINRLLVMVLMVYILTINPIGDLLILPLAAMIMGISILVIRLLKSQCLQSCYNRLRQ